MKDSVSIGHEESEPPKVGDVVAPGYIWSLHHKSMTYAVAEGGKIVWVGDNDQFAQLLRRAVKE